MRKALLLIINLPYNLKLYQEVNLSDMIPVPSITRPVAIAPIPDFNDASTISLRIGDFVFFGIDLGNSSIFLVADNIKKSSSSLVVEKRARTAINGLESKEKRPIKFRTPDNASIFF